MKAVSGTFALKITGYILGFLLTVFLARLMGVHALGLYILAWSWLRLLIIFGRFGADYGAMRFLGAYKEEGSWDAFHGFTSFTSRLIMVKSLATAIIAGIASWFILHGNPADQRVFWIAMAILPFWSLIFFYEAALRSIEKPFQGQLSENIIRPGLQFLFILLCLVLGIKMDASIAMMTALIAVIGACAISCRLWIRAQNNLPSAKNLQKNEKKEWYRYALYMAFLTGGAVIIRQTDVVMIGAMKGAHDAGLYGVAVRVANLAEFVLAAISPIISPILSGLYQTGQQQKLKHILKLSSLALFLGTMGICGFILILSSFILGLFGADFLNADCALKLLVLGQIANAFTGPVGMVMVMTGHHKRCAQFYAAMIIFNTLANYLLIPIWGIEGAAIATVMTFIGCNTLMSFYTIRKIGLDPTLLNLLPKRSLHQV